MRDLFLEGEIFASGGLLRPEAPAATGEAVSAAASRGGAVAPPEGRGLLSLPLLLTTPSSSLPLVLTGGPTDLLLPSLPTFPPLLAARPASRLAVAAAGRGVEGEGGRRLVEGEIIREVDKVLV